MEADIELATLILGLMLAIVVLGRGLGAIASMIDVFKIAYGAFVLMAHAARGGRVGARRKEASIRRFHVNAAIRCSARFPGEGAIA